MRGPSTRQQWLYWKSQTPEQKKRKSTMKELEKLLSFPSGVSCTYLNLFLFHMLDLVLGATKNTTKVTLGIGKHPR